MGRTAHCIACLLAVLAAGAAPPEQATPPAAPSTAATPPAAGTAAGAPDPAPPVILYDCTTSSASQDELRSIGAIRYRWFGQSTDPDSIKTGKIDVGKIVAEVERRWGTDPSGWGMLDYEEPFDTWLGLPLEHPQHQQAISEMVRAIRMVRLAYPKVKWTYYGTPRLDRWLPRDDGKTGGWSISTDSAKRRELERRIKGLGPLIAELDWINPSFYDVYENGLFVGPARSEMLANEEMWRLADAELGRTIRASLGLPQIPVIPCVSPLFQPGGVATAQRPIPVAEFLSDQVAPAVRARCDGIALWSSADFIMMLATMGTEGTLTDDDRKVRRDARNAWVPMAPDRKVPKDWTDPDLKLQLSQGLGKVIANAAVAARDAFTKARQAAGAAATPASSPGKTAGSPAAAP